MSAFLRELWTVMRINLLGIRSRLWTSVTTVLTVALVVAVLLGFEAMAGGFQSSLTSAGSDDVAIVLSHGAGKELNSSLSHEQAELMVQAPGIAIRDGRPAVSAEFYVVVDGVKKSDGAAASLALRGMDAAGPSLRPHFALLSGRMFRPGHNELIAGQSLEDAYRGLALGSFIHFGKGVWQVVGIFGTAGSIHESELWADRETVRTAFDRPNVVQSIRAGLTSPQALAGLQLFADRDVRLKLDVESEKTYYREQASRATDLILRLGLPLALAMALGAVAGAVNATYNSVASRAAEIATLRALGFGGLTAFLGTLAESIVLSLAGGLLGTLAIFFLFENVKATTIGGGYTQLVFAIHLSPSIVLSGLFAAFAIGALGGMWPARRAANLSVTEALHGHQ